MPILVSVAYLPLHAALLFPFLSRNFNVAVISCIRTGGRPNVRKQTDDSTEWGTRDVGPFDSGVSASRASIMRRRKLCVLFTVMGVSCGIGVVVREQKGVCFSFAVCLSVCLKSCFSLVSGVFQPFFR